MRILDFAWSAFSSVSASDHNKFRLILSETAQRPTTALEGEGYVVTLPLPRREKEGIFSVQGLYMDAEDNGWPTLWRLFRASLYHAAFHVLFSDMKAYSRWARGKDRFLATYTISLLEDYRITMAARKRWPGTMADIAYANYVGAMRMTDPDSIDSRALRIGSKLLLSLWGLPVRAGVRDEEDKKVLGLAEKVCGMVENSADDPRSPLLLGALDSVYDALGKSVLPQVPAFPHTEAHSGDSLFGEHLVGSSGRDEARLQEAMSALGVSPLGGDDAPTQAEFREAFQALVDEEVNRQKLRSAYDKFVASTRLAGIVFPQGDYSLFLRTREELAGPIRNIKNQLLQVKNVLDEEGGKQSGQVDVQMAMQVIASGSQRSDVFVREEPVLKDEAWAILVDASKSVSSSSVGIRGIAVCLAEVANSLMRERSRWGLFGFNESFQVLKDFDEAFSIDAKARIGGLSQRGATLLPDALVTAARSLSLRPIENRYLVVVSDCLPTGYAGIEEELADRVEDLSKKGILLVGIGIQSEAVKKYFMVNSVLTTPYELMKFFVRSYLELSSAS